MVQGVTFYSIKMSRVSHLRTLVGIHELKPMKKALVLFINGSLNTLIG